MKKIVLLLAVILLTSCSPLEATTLTPTVVDVENVLVEYKSWTRVNPEPLKIPEWLWAMCALPPPDDLARLDSPHSDYFSNVYVNKTGTGIMAQEGDRVFPLGSIVVKEKLLRANDQLAIAVGMMIKRERGYNPDGNDWEYIYWESGGNIQRGLEQFGQCQFCHIGTNIPPEAEEFYSQIEDMQVSREARDSVFTILLVTPNP